MIRPNVFPWIVVLGCVANGCGCIFLPHTAWSAEPEATAADLPRVAPTEPQKALSTFKIKKGFQLELAASEPLVVDPVAMCFDANGRMYVAEMRDYSERRDERLGRITWLEDTDGDGKYDKGGVFADRIPWPTAVMCYGGGILVGTTPDILFYKDANGDGRADDQEQLYTGFASYSINRLNVQALMNSFHWGMDLRIHGSASVSGGKVTSALRPEDPPLELRGADFSFDPRRFDIRAESGGGQHGMSFDRLGRKFVSSNSDHVQQEMYDIRYRLDSAGDWPSPNVSIAVDGPAAPVFRISPDEPWRVIRTRWRVAGTVEGMIEGGGRPSGYFTGATGVTVYEGDAFPEEYRGDIFVADCGSNLVHHKKLRRTGLQPVAERPADEAGVEFLASTDNWFRPVQFVNGPDGTLYVLDMYRETIEHPWSLPPGIKKHLDLNSGNDRGRIYRIVPENFKRRAIPRLTEAKASELVELLGHPNAWHRESASRLLFERQDFEQAKLLVREAARKSTNEMTRLLSYQVWASWGEDATEPLTPELLMTGLRDPSPIVRRHSLRILEQLLPDPDRKVPDVVVGALRPLSRDPDLDVRYQLAWTLGYLDVPGKVDLWINLMESGLQDPWMRRAVMNSLRADATGVLEQWTKKAAQPPSSTEWGGEICRIIGQRRQMSEWKKWAELMDAEPSGSTKLQWAAGFLAGIDSALSGEEKQFETTVVNRLLETASTQLPGRGDTSLSATSKAAVRILLRAPGHEWRQKIWDAALNAPKESSALQRSLVEALMRQPGLVDFERALSDWAKLGTEAKDMIQPHMLRRSDGIAVWLKGVESGVISRQGLGISELSSLRNHADAGIRKAVVALFGSGSSERRQDVVDRHLNAVTLKGDRNKGLELYRQRCATCHRLSGQGNALGPDLESVQSMGKEKLLVNILDPNREVQPQYQSYRLSTVDGEDREGLLISETPNQVTLRQAGGLETSWKRSDIKSMQSSGRSLMPEGLEEGLNDQALADLLQLLSGGR